MVPLIVPSLFIWPKMTVRDPYRDARRVRIHRRLRGQQRGQKGATDYIPAHYIPTMASVASRIVVWRLGTWWRSSYLAPTQFHRHFTPFTYYQEKAVVHPVSQSPTPEQANAFEFGSMA